MNILKRWRMLAWLCVIPWALAFGQDSQTVTGTACTQGIDVTGAATLGIQVTGGSWSGTIQPTAAIQGQSTVNIQVTPSTSTTAQSTITANGVYTAAVAGYSVVIFCGNTVSGGAATLYFNVSHLSSSNRGGGGGSSGTVTSVTFTGDGTVLSSTPSSAVTTSGTLTATLANAAAHTIFGNTTGSSAAGAYSTAPSATSLTLTDATAATDFSMACTTVATSSTVCNAPVLSIAGTNWTGAASRAQILTSSLTSGTGTNPFVFQTWSLSGSTNTSEYLFNNATGAETRLFLTNTSTPQPSFAANSAGLTIASGGSSTLLTLGGGGFNVGAGILLTTSAFNNTSGTANAVSIGSPTGFNPSSGSGKFNALSITPTITCTSTATCGFSIISAYPTETSLGAASGARWLIDVGVLTTQKFGVDDTGAATAASFVSANGSIVNLSLPIGTATFTGGTGVTSVACASGYSCNNTRGTLTIVGGTGTTGTIATVTFSAALSAAPACFADENGGATLFGIGNSAPTTTAFNITAGISIIGATFNADYRCQP